MYPSTQSIREIVKTHPSAINVFERFDVDLCSRTDSSLEQACAELQLSIDQVLEKLAKAESAEPGATATSARFNRIDENRNISVRMDGSKDKTVTFNAQEMRHFDHGYAVTSHSSQGLTAGRVLVNMDTNVHPELINSRFAYVSVSRASHDAQIYTNDAASLAESLSRDVSKASAIDFGKAQSPVANVGLEQAAAALTKIPAAGLGLGL
jgi:hypothetical protein